MSPAANGRRRTGVTFLPLALLAIATLALVPSATAAGSTSILALQAGYAQATLHLEGTVTGADASSIRAAIDDKHSGGDGDGIVRNDEVNAFLATYRAVFQAKAASGILGGNLTLDGKPPTRADLATLQMRGAEGPVNGTQPIVTVMDLRIALQPANTTTHTLVSRAVASTNPATMTVTAPPGQLLLSTTGLPEDARKSADGQSITFTATGGERTFVFGPPEAAKAPLAGPLPIVAIAAAAVAGRLRQGQK